MTKSATAVFGTLSPRSSSSLPPRCIRNYVAGLHQHMVQAPQPGLSSGRNPQLTRKETQHSRYLSSFSFTQEG